MAPAIPGGRGLKLNQVLEAALGREIFKLPAAHWKILHQLRACRTPAMGAHRYVCSTCEREKVVPHACRNRHCPGCQVAAAEQWLEDQKACLLPIGYFHLVFTLPHALNRLIQQNQRRLYNLLFSSASATLLAFGQERFGGQLGVSAVLHTWGQTLIDHYHLHCIVTGGGWDPEGAGWVGAPGGYLFPVEALSEVFQGKFCQGLKKLFERGKLEFHGQLQGLGSPAVFEQLFGQLWLDKWVVYAKRPFAGPEEVLAYLSRYTHRVAITQSRLLDLDREQGIVRFRYKDYADGRKEKVLPLSLREFVRRLCLHFLPERLVKIRHYGLLANRRRHQRLEKVRATLGVTPQPEAPTEPAPESDQTEEKETALICPYCRTRTLELIEVLPAEPQPEPELADTS